MGDELTSEIERTNILKIEKQKIRDLEIEIRNEMP